MAEIKQRVEGGNFGGECLCDPLEMRAGIHGRPQKLVGYKPGHETEGLYLGEKENR